MPLAFWNMAACIVYLFVYRRHHRAAPSVQLSWPRPLRQQAGALGHRIRFEIHNQQRKGQSYLQVAMLHRHRFLLPFSVVTLDANCRRADLHAESPGYYNMASFVICGPSTILVCHSLFS